MRDRLLPVTSAQRESQQYRAENRNDDGPDAAGAGQEKCEHSALLPSRIRSALCGKIPVYKFTHHSNRNKSKDPAHHTTRFASQVPAGRIAGFEPNTR